jgi:hypothetical protein
MNKKLVNVFQVLLITLSVFVLTGCIEMISAVGTGAFTTAEYVVAGAVSKTISYEFGRTKKALLVALCRMEILVDRAREIEDGEEITAKVDELEIRVKLKQITPTVTRISVSAKKGFMGRDRATAQEIIRQTKEIAEKLITYSAVAQRSAQV